MHSFLQVIVKRLVSTIRLQSWGLIGCIHNEIYGKSTTVALARKGWVHWDVAESMGAMSMQVQMSARDV